MISAVLLSGHLTQEKLDRAAEEIKEREPPKSFCLVIDSAGGDMKSTTNFVEALWAGWLENLEGIKIYNAQSAAAFIALAFPVYREMRKGAVLGIHRGAAILEASEFDLKDGKVVNKNTINWFKQYGIYLDVALEKCGLSSDSRLTTELYATNWIHLPAEECLKRGVVNRLF